MFFRPLGLTEWHSGSRQYDVISCLNVLDRCDEPITLLEHMRHSLVPESGRLIIAMVLPYSPYVEFSKYIGTSFFVQGCCDSKFVTFYPKPLKAVCVLLSCMASGCVGGQWEIKSGTGFISETVRCK